MDKDALHRSLEQRFLATFLPELIPGMIHNFANPLNGILGRLKLMQRRMEGTLGTGTAGADGPLPSVSCDARMIRDINAVNEEAERFHALFHRFAGKIAHLHDRTPCRINLSEMVGQEVQFADFYLDFKHHVRKDVRLDDNLPDIRGVPAVWSLCLICLLHGALREMRGILEPVCLIETGSDGEWVRLHVRHAVREDRTILPWWIREGKQDEPSPGEAADEDLFWISSLLGETSGAKFHLSFAGSVRQIAISVPCIRAGSWADR